MQIRPVKENVMAEEDTLVTQIDALGQKLTAARAEIARAFIGQDRVVELALSAMLGGGHALVVGLPGLGKTLLVDTLSRVMGLTANRIQFTPDLMPADILGSEVLETATDGARAFRFLPGPVFCQLLMADEINRASPRTQSALLQAMQEREVTIAGQHRKLGPPFHVLATQNPIEQEGTYPLPEAQLDRFLVQIDVDYPTRGDERAILLATTGVDVAKSATVFTAEDLIAAQALIRRMPVGDKVVEAILDLVRGCRPDQAEGRELQGVLAWGPGPRAAQALMLLVRVRALLQGRLAPSLEDVAALARPVLIHRMSLTFAARARGESLGAVIDRAVGRVLGREAAA
jgi:MoxR-like ATPase